MRTIGQSDDRPAKTPTLREYFKQHNDSTPKQSLVVRVFLPNKYETYGFITDHDFRVQVRKGQPLYDLLADEIEMCAATSEPLWVRVLDGAKGLWELAGDDSSRISWTDNDYGFTCTGLEKRSATEPVKSESRRSKPPASSTVES